MPSALPPGDPVPEDGSLPEQALAGFGERPFGFYVHVPFCRVRCGYCDFNTYTAEELGDGATRGASRSTYAEAAIAEVRRARAVLRDTDAPVETVFFGGGTPTLLSPADLGAILAAIAGEFGLADDAEVTTEANHVLAVLDRTHDPLRVPAVVDWARAAGFAPAEGGSISLDLIYGTPGESPADWEASLDAALACAPDHVSAYSLIVEDGTALARRVRRGELPMPDEDDLADKYLLADARLEAAGLGWYEVSNWSSGEATRCRHNLLYWTGGDWWGVGPGAHSHVGGVRWWNVKHPVAYADRLGAGRSPAQAREVLDAETRRVERVLLELRLRDGLPVDTLDEVGLAAVPRLIADGLLEPPRPDRAADRLVLTRRGRLLADGVVRDLLP